MSDLDDGLRALRAATDRDPPAALAATLTAAVLRRRSSLWEALLGLGRVGLLPAALGAAAMVALAVHGVNELTSQLGLLGWMP